MRRRATRYSSKHSAEIPVEGDAPGEHGTTPCRIIAEEMVRSLGRMLRGTVVRAVQSLGSANVLVGET